MADPDDPESVHEAFADPAACGLAAAILLLFSVLLIRGAGEGVAPEVMMVTTEFEWSQPVPASAAEYRFRADWADKTLLRVAHGVAEPVELFRPEGEPAGPTVDLAAGRPVFLRTPARAATPITLSTEPLKLPDRPPAVKWVARLTVQFPGRPAPVEVRWNFPAGLRPRTAHARVVTAGARAADQPEPRPTAVPDGKTSVRITATRAGAVIVPE